MEDGIEQHSSMLINKVYNGKDGKDSKVENYKSEMSKAFLYVYTPPNGNKSSLEYFETSDAISAMSFAEEKKCALEIFTLDFIKGTYQSTKTFINPPQSQA